MKTMWIIGLILSWGGFILFLSLLTFDWYPTVKAGNTVAICFFLAYFGGLMAYVFSEPTKLSDEELDE